MHSLVAELVVAMYLHVEVCPFVSIGQSINQRLFASTSREVSTFGATVLRHNVCLAKVGDGKLQVVKLLQYDHGHHNPKVVDGEEVGDKTKLSQEFPGEWVERKSHPNLTDGHKGDSDVLGSMLPSILDLVIGDLANYHVVRYVVLSAKVFILPGIPAEEVGVRAYLTPLFKVGNLCVYVGTSSRRDCMDDEALASKLNLELTLGPLWGSASEWVG